MAIFTSMVVLSVPLTLVSILIAVVMVTVTTRLGKWSRKYFRVQQESLARVNGFIEEMMTGQKVVKVFCHVLQETHLFTGTVLDNIRYGCLDASNEDCIKAAQLVGAHEFIRRLPDGYQTMLQADGSNLSQGERQLIAIARAAVANPIGCRPSVMPTRSLSLTMGV